MTFSSVAETALNFRKLRQEFAPSTLKEGKKLASIQGSCKAHILFCTSNSFVIEASVLGFFSDWHACQLEIDRNNSSIILSHCDCPSHVDCHHLASLLFFLEEQFHRLLVDFQGGQNEKDSTDTTLIEAKKKSLKKVELEEKKAAVKEFVEASSLLSTASLLIKREEPVKEAELFINIGPAQAGPRKMTELSFAVKLPERPKPVSILQPKLFFQSMILEDPLFLGTTLAVLSLKSFGVNAVSLLECLRYAIEFVDRSDRPGKAAFVQSELVDHIFIEALHLKQQGNGRITLFSENFDRPYILNPEVLYPEFNVSLITEPQERLVVRSRVKIKDESVPIRDVKLIRGSVLGCIRNEGVFLLPSTLQPKVKEELETLDTIIIPKELYGTFFSYSLPELEKKGHVTMSEEVRHLSQQPFDTVFPKLSVQMDVVEGKLSVFPSFVYKDTLLPEAKCCTKKEDMSSGTIARDLAEEVRQVQRLLWGFVFDQKDGSYTTVSERKISEFFLETLSSKIRTIDIHIDSSLKPYISTEMSFISISLQLKEIGNAQCTCSIQGPVKGPLKHVPVARVLEASRLRRAAIEVDIPATASGWNKRYVCLGSDMVDRLSQCLESLSVPFLDTCEWTIPLWNGLSVNEKLCREVGIQITLDDRMQELKQSLLAPAVEKNDPPILASSIVLKQYQMEGLQWLRQLKAFSLAGILADDMGLGKTPQTIAILAEAHLKNVVKTPSLIVCPTSLVENWVEEIRKFQPLLIVTLLSGTPQDRKKLLENTSKTHIFIASYGLVQKDLDLLKEVSFSYIILDEGQAIKNRETLTARAVKDLQGLYRLVLTGTPIENSLEDLWSLFDFLMPGFLGSFDKFIRQYIKPADLDKSAALESLKKRIQPFVLRRMKQDVLKDLPPITHSVVHCSLGEGQSQLYARIASQARTELEEIVNRDGFDKAKLHVLAVLTRLKQICCHPRLIQEEIDCSKYDLLFQMLSKIKAVSKKAVIFSQYAKMLGIIKQSLDTQGIASITLDGSTKNRLSLVQKFNEDSSIPFFLVSLRAGGNGLNLVGADTVIHYDIWWNPAVENQATDRVWRMGQQENVHSYKLITKGTIEEKIVELQEKKKDLITNVVDSDEDMLSRLTWPDVLELLSATPQAY